MKENNNLNFLKHKTCILNVIVKKLERKMRKRWLLKQYIFVNLLGDCSEKILMQGFKTIEKY